jgi:predicted acylesterase/phospholipase RssA
MTPEETNQSGKAFKEIALSLSGGGFRAAAFHLGAMKMLDCLGLLDQVRVLSTVSGGTIVGAAWANSLSEGKNFGQFYGEFKNFLQNNNVIEKALNNLSASVSINDFAAMPSLIRAAAAVYAESRFLGDKTFGAIKFAPDGTRTQLKEIVFNATDFRTGNCFRFQHSDSPRVNSGNNKFEVKKSVNEMIRLADIVAASSCFPSGFEPLRFPSDFSWGSGDKLDEVKKLLGENFTEEIALMDGGVFDNQGIDSIERIYERKNNEIELYIISDTSQRDDSLLNSPVAPLNGWLRLWQLSVLLWLLMLASLVTMTTIVIDAVQTYQAFGISLWRGIFLYLIPFLLAAGAAGFLIWGRNLLTKVLKKFNAETGIDVWRHFKILTVPALIEILVSRAQSLIAMAGSVFMKRIRDLGYTRIFVNPNFEAKVLPNIIYDLDNESKWGNEIRTANLTPSAELRKIAVDAEAYPTNLWFINSDVLEKLILCGEATMCFKILKYLLKYRSSELVETNSPEADLFRRASARWSELQ